MLVSLPGPGIPAVDVGGKEENLQQQACIELDLKEDNRKQRDVYQAEEVIAYFLKTRQTNTQQPGDRPHSFDPRQIVTASADRNMYQNVLRAKKVHLFPQSKNSN